MWSESSIFAVTWIAYCLEVSGLKTASKVPLKDLDSGPSSLRVRAQRTCGEHRS